MGSGDELVFCFAVLLVIFDHSFTSIPHWVRLEPIGPRGSGIGLIPLEWYLDFRLH